MSNFSEYQKGEVALAAAVRWLGGGREGGADVRGRVGGRGAVVRGRVGQEIEFPEWKSGDSAAILCSFSDSVLTIADSRDTSPSRKRNLVLNSILSVCSAAVSGPLGGDLIGVALAASGCIGCIVVVGADDTGRWVES